MEAFLLAAALVASFGTLVIFYRANRLAALPADKATVSGKVTSLMVSAGKWLTVAGGIGTLPLVALLVFAPNASTSGFQWVYSSGFAGCLAFVLAALLLVTAGLINGIGHSDKIKRLVVGGARFVLDKGLSLARKKAFWLSLAAITVVVAFLPWIIDLLTFAGYAALLVLAGKFGLINHKTQEDEISGAPQGGVYNYATGDVDSGFEIGGLYDD